jgi:hypothetical protein
MERPKRKPTTKSKTGVKKESRLNNQQDESALALKTTDPVEKKIDPNSPEADLAVLEALLEMATKGKNTTAAIFWAKTRCGMREVPRKKERPASQAPTIVIRTEGKQA